MNRYIDLLRRHPRFVRLWLAQAISLLGDFFNTIIISALVSRLSGGSGLAITILLLAKFLPPLIVSPVAGVLLDRFDRRRMLIISDTARMLIVLGYLFVDTPEELPLIYVLTVAQFIFSAIFEPGRAALLPAVLAAPGREADERYRQDLVLANIIGSTTWSAMLALGGVLGGLISATLGSSAGLLLDAATFGVSALLIASIRVNAAPDIVPGSEREAHEHAPVRLRDYLAGIRFALRRPDVGAVLLVKAGGSLGSVDALVIVYATFLFVAGQDGAASLGVLWSAFGIGAVLSPFLMQRFNDGSVRTMRRLIIVSYALIAVGWFAFAGAATLLLAAIGLMIKAMGSNLYWTYSSVIIQKTAPDAYLGRMFSLDMAGFQLATVLSVLLSGAVLEAQGFAVVRAVTLATGLISLLPLVAWALIVRWLEARERSAPAAAVASLD
jgi:MFS family permease